jgi:hypothetical protein
MKRYPKKRTDKATSTMLRVPNDLNGRLFVEQLRYYAAGGTRIRCVGRGPRKEAAAARARAAGGNPRGWHNSFRQKLPLEFAEYMAVYIEKTDNVSVPRKPYHVLCNKLWHFEQEEIPHLLKRLQAVTEDRYHLQQHCHELHHELAIMQTVGKQMYQELLAAREALRIMAEHQATATEASSEGGFTVTIQLQVKPGKA